jgi:uncharacterized radical SAM protein YgiQ
MSRRARPPSLRPAAAGPPPRPPSAPRGRYLPVSREDLEARGWDGADIVLVTGDAHIDHPSFGVPLLGRLLEGLGYRVGIIAQPDWRSPEPFLALGRPKLFAGVSGGAMDSLVSNYTTGKKFRRADAYSPGGKGGLRPNRAVLVYANRIREAMPGVPLVIGGIEASLRRFVHYDFWEDALRRSCLLDAKADILVYGPGELQVAEIARRLAAGLPVESLRGIPGTAMAASRRDLPALIDAAREHFAVAWRGPEDTLRMEDRSGPRPEPAPAEQPAPPVESASFAGGAPGASPALAASPELPRRVLEIPSWGRLLELDREGRREVFLRMAVAIEAEASPSNGKIIVQHHGDRALVVYPPVRPLSTPELDALHALPFTREPHPAYGGAPIPAYEMIKFSIATQRGCFGGCTFCAIAAHQGRAVQSRSPESVIAEIEALKEVPGFAGIISDLGGPTANMYRMGCTSPEAERVCRRSSCVWPTVCRLLGTDHGPLLDLLRRARELPGVRKAFVSSGVRHDLALRSPEFIRELARHHTSGHLKVAPEHASDRVLRLMKKPPIALFDEFRKVFEAESRAAGKEQYVIPYFISSFPGSTEEDMAATMEYLKGRGLRLEQVQDFLPTPMTIATAMHYAGREPGTGEKVACARSDAERSRQKAYLRWHDPKSRKVLRSRAKKK